MRAEKLGIPLQRFRKYSSSFLDETAGFHAEKRWRFRLFSAASEHAIGEVKFVHRIFADLSARAVESHRSCFISPSTTRASWASFCIFSSRFSPEAVTSG